MLTTRLVGAITLLAVTVGVADAEPITTRLLLEDMTDLPRLAKVPDPPYTLRQFSSYDPQSKTPDDHEAWFANGDCGQYLRTEEHDGRTEHVMMDADGPGAIVRIWSANPKGTLRFYFDGSDTPAWEVLMTDLLGGKLRDLQEPISGVRAAGWNLYFPIPYAKHCKLTCDEGGFYYHVNYRTYPADTEFHTFKPEMLMSLAPEIARAAQRLKGPHGYPRPQPQEQVLGLRMGTIKPGTTGKQMVIKGQRAINRLGFRIKAEDVERALRQSILMIEFDGEQTVECPLGDFFGTAPGLTPYASYPAGINDKGELWCLWYMPFAEQARISVRNLGDQEIRITGGASYVPHEWTDRSMYFHAGWRTSQDLPTRPMRDWNYCDLKGRGRFVGAAFYVTNPVKQWWGEGDEKIYVDGESFPSFFGTGTEDYFGYAWCNPAVFNHAYHNQPRCDGPGNYGHSAVNRWHIIDDIPFAESFRFDMEIWHWAETKIDASVAAFWYAKPEASSTFKSITKQDVEWRPAKPYVAPRVAGAIEGEEMKIVAHTGEIGPQEIAGCSNEKHLWWRHPKPGDKLVLGFEVKESGRYRVLGHFVKARDYGIMQLSINGVSAGEPIDFFEADRIALTDEIDLGVFELIAGTNEVAAEVIGANEDAVKSYMFGLDYLRLEAE